MEKDNGLRLSREGFLRAGAGAGAVLSANATAGGLLSGNHIAAADASELSSASAKARCARAFALRRDAASVYLANVRQPGATNGDEARYADKRASFAKTLAHNEFGEVDPQAYAALVAAIASGDPDRIESLQRAPGAVTKLNNPQAAYAFDMVGVDSNATRLPAPPAFGSALAAAEMAEVYWQALTRDVPFRQYEDSKEVAAAVRDLNAFASPAGAALGKTSPLSVFRGETEGDRIGPYLSQFLWLEVPYGIARIDQRYRLPAPGQHFLTDRAEWLACQRGQRSARKLVWDSTHRYMASPRDLAEYVHQDFSYQPYLNAALIMTSYGMDAFSATNPYRKSVTQSCDITLGNKNVLTMLAEASLIAQKGAWYQKWLVHRRLRPEVFGGRIDQQMTGARTYDIHPDILHSEALARVKAANGTYLVPVAFAEGSPTHPSYPAAHAANAGACVTILKAFFNEDFVIPSPVQANSDGSALEPWQGAPLTLGNEINKLAANIAIGRDAAGVHYRSDSVNGMLGGEDQAIGLLADYSLTYNERFDGFRFKTLAGKTVRIAKGVVSYA